MIIQMHIGELHPIRLACIESVDRIYHNIPSIWIDDSSIKEHVAKMNSFLSIDHVWPMNTLRDICWLSDWIRFFYLSIYPYGIWIDTDVTIKKPFVPDQSKGRPYFGVGDNDDAMDYAYIFCNGCCDWFHKILKRRISENRFGILCNEIDGSVGEKIHLEYFHHHGSPNNLNKQPERHWTNELKHTEETD